MSTNSKLTYLNLLKESGINNFLQNSPNVHILEKKDGASHEIKKNIKTNNLDEISGLEELKNYIKNFKRCDLIENANTTVFSDGNPSSKIMLIGEAPGSEEDKLGKPFVGLAGQLLNKMLAAINISRNEVYITNILPWRPPNNRTPNTEEILMCLPFIQKHIDIINPHMIVLLGGTAAKAILTTNLGITKLRGKWHEYKSLKLNKTIIVRAIYHPAFLLRSPENKKDAWEDLKEIQTKINEI